MFALALAGCATDAFKEGKELIAAGYYSEGFARVEEAVEKEPRNIEYKLFLRNRKETVIASLFAKADNLRDAGQLPEAEKIYQEVLKIDAHHAPANAGLEKIAVERRHRFRVKEAEALLKANELVKAAEVVRLILAENPIQRDARTLESHILEMQAKQARAPIRLAASFRQLVTLEFRDAPVRSVFDVLARASRINFVFDRDIRPDLKVTIFVKNTPMDEAIRIIGLTSQLETRVLNENSILVYPNNPQKLKDYQQLSVRSFNLANADAKQVATTLKTLLKVKDIVVNDRLNVLMVRDTPEVIRLAEKIVALEDVSESEVMLEVEVLEVKRSSLLDLGVQWPAQVGLTPLGSSTSSSSETSGVSNKLTLGQLRGINSSTIGVGIGSTTIKAQHDNSDANILANPRIRVRNKEKAKIMIGDRVPVITSTSTSTGFVSDSVSYVDVGLKLEVEPNIFLDDEVSMKVNLEVSNLVREITSKSGTLSYQIGTRNASTTLRLRDGETQVLAGLINDEDRRSSSRVPGLGELPILNRIFGSQKDDSQKTEIVLSITPRLVRSVRRPDILNAEFEVGTESSLGSPGVSLSSPTPSGPASDAGHFGVHGRGGMDPASVSHLQGQGSANPLPSSHNSTSATSPDALRFSWEGPAQVRVGDQFVVTLRLNATFPVSALPSLVSYDPAVLQVATVLEGDFLRQGGGTTSFSSQIDSASGRISIADVRQNGPVNGGGSVAIITFRALRPAAQVKIQLLSVTPNPMPAGAMLPAPDLVLNVH